MQQELSQQVFQKIEKLLKAHAQLKEAHQQLQQQLETSKQLVHQQSQQVAALENEVAGLKSARSQTDVANRQEMEQRIDQYIKDIDNAIMLLNE